MTPERFFPLKKQKWRLEAVRGLTEAGKKRIREYGSVSIPQEPSLPRSGWAMKCKDLQIARLRR
jgi:hypothetical protein